MAGIKSFKIKNFLKKKDSGREKNEVNNENLNNNNNQPADNRTMHSKIARHKILLFYKTCLGIAGCIFAALCIYVYLKNIIYTDYEVRQQYEWTRSSESSSINLNGVLFTYSKDGMSCTDTRGKIIWNQTYEMQEPIMRYNRNAVAVGDYNGRSIYVSDTSGNLGTIETTMPIRDFCVAANGVVAAVLDDTTVTAIYLYNVNGEQLAYFKTTMSKSGYPLAIAISDDATQVAVSYLKAENGAMSSSIGFYKFSSVGQNYTDNLVGGYGYTDAVVPVLDFMGNDTVFAVADSRLMFYQGKQKPVNTADILISDEIQSVFYDKSHVGLVYYNISGDSMYRLDVYDTNAKKVNERAIDLEYDEILFNSSGIVIYNENDCIIYDWDGRLKYNGSFKEPVECVIPSGSIARYTLVTDNSIQMIQLK